MALVASGGAAFGAPVLDVSPTPLNFGAHRVLDTAVGSTATQVFTVSNTGNGMDLDITGAAISGGNAGDFTITVPLGTTTLPPGMSTTLTVQFNPSSAGNRVASLDVTSSNGGNVSVALAGSGTNALITVTDVNFGTVTNGTTSTSNITVSNLGSTPQGALHVVSATLSGGSWFTFGATPTASCNGQTTCNFGGVGFDVPPTTTVSVKCSPPANATGMQTATVTFTSDTDPGGDDVADLLCTAGRADISIVDPAPPMPVAFGDVLINPTPVPTKTVSIGNTGNQNLVFTATKSGAAALTARYTLGGCFSNCTVMPGTMQQFTLAFNPNAPTNPNADISIAISSNDPDNGTVTIPVTSRGIAPGINPSTATLAFGNVELGMTSGTQTLTVTNDGTSTLNITNASFVSGGTDYTATAGTTGPQTTAVAVGDSVSWDIVCNPTAQGSRPGTFRVQSNAFGETTVDIGLTCTGTQGNLSVTGSPINFGAVIQGNTATTAFTLRNTGNLPVTGITAVVNPNNKGYSLDPATPVPTTLAAGASVSLNARFQPTAPTDGGAATVTFTGGWGGGPTATTAVLNLTGSVLSTGFVLTPNMIDFGNLRFDTAPTRTFCIQNIGMAALSITAITITPAMGTMSGEFAVTSVRRPATACAAGGTTVTLPASISTASTDSLVVTVTADPANRLGAMGATVTVTSNLAANPTRTLTLAGNSTSGALTITPSSTIDFGPIDVQGAAAMQMFTITNTGDAPLDLASFARTADPEFTITLPGGTQTLQPNGAITIPITYKPVVASPATSPETVTITHSITGVINVTMGGTLIVRGRGIDRNLSLLAAPSFPDTFRNPGDQAPVKSATIRNTGEAVLKVSAVMITTATDVWQLVDPAPVDIAPGATHDFGVRFAPKHSGRAPDATLRLVNDDDARPMFDIPLVGTGLDRNVLFAPDTIRLGFTSAGASITIDGALVVINLDAQHTFMIRSIELDEGPFTIEDAPADLTLQASETRSFGVTFTPEAEGDFSIKARLFLDMDPESQHEVILEGSAVTAAVHGGGGCNAGDSGRGTTSLPTLAALAVLVALRRRRVAALRAAALCAVLVLVPARASADDVLVGTFHPTPATTSVGFQVEPADVGRPGAWIVTSVLSYATNPMVVDVTQQGTVLGTARPISQRSMLELGGALALLGRFELGVRMPLYLQRGTIPAGAPLDIEPASGTALGDLALHARTRLLRATRMSVGTTLHLTLPTSTKDQFTGTDLPTARLLALATFRPASRLTLALNGGAVLRKTAAYQRAIFIEQGSGLAWGAGASAQLSPRLLATGEVFGELLPTSERMAGSLSPIEGLVGASYRVERRATIGLAVGRGLASGLGAPDLRGSLTLSFAPGAAELPVRPRPPRQPRIRIADADHDGIPDATDRCPNLPEDKNGIKDTDGCPDRDSDRDGLLDVIDRCPNQAEDQDGFQDTDGCPDLDNDADGIPDAKDHCPTQAEDKNGIQDSDGCPDQDTDRDGVIDVNDRCPGQPEDRDGFEDTDGCPDPDNDADGVPDAQDRCPIQPETINGKDDDDGCPDQGGDTTEHVVIEPGQSSVQAADTTFKRGRELMQQKKFFAACAAFEQSQRLDPQAGTQFNLAGCYAEIGKLATAWNLYRELARTDKKAERRARASELANELAPRVPKLKLVLIGQPAGLIVFMNDTNVNALVGLESPVDLGTYTIVAGAPNHRGWRQVVEVKREGEMNTVEIDLGPPLEKSDAAR